MNQTQLKYARTRAETIRIEKLQKIRNKYFIPAVKLTNGQKLQAIKNGEFTITYPSSNNYYGNWYNDIKFNAEKEAVNDLEKVKKEQAVVESQFTKLMDELILGDNEEALKLLSAFESA